MNYNGIKYDKEYNLSDIIGKLEGNIGYGAVIPICK